MIKPHGVYTALVTPFKNGKVDFVSLEKLVLSQMKGGIHRFVVNGTTAESPTLKAEESLEILKFVKKTAGDKASVMFGSGSNDTAKTIEFSKMAVAAGAESLLLVVPYYNKPPQEGLYLHFKKIADEVECPQVLYNVPGRTITSFEVETLERLAQHPRIVGIKEATGNLEFGEKIISRCGSAWSILSGDDETSLDLQKRGGSGVISVCSHIMAKKMSEWFSAKSPNESALQEFSQSRDLIRSLYITSNPIPVKAALHILGIIESDEMRLPLCTLTKEQKKSLEKVLKKYEMFL